ncbi:MAG: hypothetical protein ACXAC8_02225 [Candidatus Hodarchaeales archaeon]|jgi:hypothetical protein
MKYCDLTPPSVKDLQKATRNNEWPNHFCRNAIIEQAKSIRRTKTDKHLPLVNAHDVTDDPRATEEAVRHEPKIKMLGQGLHSEKKSNSWGGMMYRVLGDDPTIEGSSNLCIQYIYTYVRQKLPFTLYNLVIPLIFLLFISVYFKFDTISYVETSTGEVAPVSFRIISQYYYIFALILGALIFITGMIDLNYTYKTRNVVSVRSLILVILSVIFAFLLLIEYVFFFEPFWTLIVSYAINEQSTDIDLWAIQIGLVPIVLLFLTLGSIILIIYQDALLKNRLTGIWNFLIRKLSHDMDYAPVFVNLEKDKKNRWKVSTIRSDRLHYCITEKGGKAARKYMRKGRPSFIMRGLHHSVELARPYQIRFYYLKVIFSFILFLVLISMFAVLTFLDIDIFAQLQSLIHPIIPIETLSYAIAMFLYRLVYSVAVFGCIYYVITRRPFEVEIDKDQKLSEVRYYHLNCTKLQILWNLKKEAQFLIQEKLQNPFSENVTEVSSSGKQKKFWDSFYDSEQSKGDMCS